MFWPRSITLQTEETHRQKHERADHHFLSLDSHNGNLKSHIKTAQRCCAAHVCQSSYAQNLRTSTMQHLISAKIILSSLCRFSPSDRSNPDWILHMKQPAVQLKVDFQQFVKGFVLILERLIRIKFFVSFDIQPLLRDKTCGACTNCRKYCSSRSNWCSFCSLAC